MKRAPLCGVLLTASLLLSGCGLSFQNVPFESVGGTKTYPITIEASDSSQLRNGGLVRIGQSEVGKISSITAHDYVAAIHVDIRADVPVVKGTKAKLQLPSPLGEEFIQLIPPAGQSGQLLGDGGVIPVTDTTRGPDPEDLLAALGTLLRGSGIAKVQTIVQETNTILNGREDEIKGMFTRLDSILHTLNDNTGTIETTLHNMDSLVGYAKDNQATINRVLTESEPGINAILAQKDQLNALIGRVNTLTNTVNQFVGQNRGYIVDIVDKLRPPLDGLLKLKNNVATITANISKLGPNLAAVVPGDYITINAAVDIPDVVGKLLGQGAGIIGKGITGVTGTGTAGPNQLLQVGTR